jgi:serine/threonine-protein kinase RsbW
MKAAAELNNLYTMLDAVKDFAEKQGMKGEKLNQLEVALEEILVNISSYGYPATSGSIEIQYRVTGDHNLVIEISDWGIPFDPLARPEADTTLPLEERKIGGLGIFFVRQIAKKVHYRREDDKNILTLVFDL